MMEKEPYIFHLETFWMVPPYDDDGDDDNEDSGWYREFPVLLTEEQFERMRKTHAEWLKTDDYKKLSDLDDESLYLMKCVPDIYEIVMEEIKKRVPIMWNEGIIPYIDQIGIFVPEEVWE